MEAGMAGRSTQGSLRSSSNSIGARCGPSRRPGAPSALRSRSLRSRLSGKELAGVLVSLAALYTGMCSYSGAYGARLRMMLNTTACMTVVTIFATLVCRSDFATVLLVVLISLVMGLYSSSSAAAATIGVYGVCIFVVLSGLPLEPPRRC